MIASQLPLHGLRVGISGSVPEREYWGKIADLDRLILTFVAQLSALIIRYGGTVVHGSEPLFTPVLTEQARRQAHEGNVSLKLFASQVFGEVSEVTRRAVLMAHTQVVMTRPVGKGDYRDPKTHNDSLTSMRLAMTKDIDVLVAVGGKLHLNTSFIPGVLEELAYARWHGVPCFIVGAAGYLEQPILDELSAGNMLGSGAAQTRSIATLTDSMDEYVGKLLVHLARHKERFRKPRRGEHGRSAFGFLG